MVELTLDIDGYDVVIEADQETIQRKLDALEVENPKGINKNGETLIGKVLQQYVRVHATPTDEKWAELAKEGI